MRFIRVHGRVIPLREQERKAQGAVATGAAVGYLGGVTAKHFKKVAARVKYTHSGLMNRTVALASDARAMFKEGNSLAGNISKAKAHASMKRLLKVNSMLAKPALGYGLGVGLLGYGVYKTISSLNTLNKIQSKIQKKKAA